MKVTYEHAVYGTITYEESAWSGSAQLYFNGEKLEKISKSVFVKRGADYSIDVSIRGNFMLGVEMTVNNVEKVQIVAKPKWYEVLFAIIPLILIMVWGNNVALCKIVPVVGGAIGGAISGVLGVCSFLTIKRIKNVWLKLLVGLGFTALVFGICALLGFAILSALK